MSDDAVTSAEQLVIERAATFAETVIEPLAHEWHRDQRFASEAIEAAGPAELNGLLVEPSLGGEGLGEVALAHVLEVLAAADLGAAFSLVVHNNMARAVATSGNPHLVDHLLPRLISGEDLGAFLLTEPGAGSDAAAITCSATLDGDDWVINGEKSWITSATDATALNLYAQTDPELGHRGMVAIVVDADTRGVTRLPAFEVMGGHAMGTGGFRFDDVRVGTENTLVEVGKAFASAMVGIDLARVLVGAMCTGIMRRSLEVAITATRDRHIFGSPVSSNQGIQWMLADVATDLEATRLLTFRAARLLQNREPATIAAAHAKKFAARKAQERIADCMQVMGANGYRPSPDNPLPRHLAAARLTGYIDGATEIQNVVIARQLLDDRRPARSLEQ